ncbi:hypothetical protein J0X14_05940 [Muricauda sp. CAU 1633]|uniref:hypothetical protein n=1 Tax=Allomuricauda sp. CAU 1633 TaxID=2816036 RepID=UPI001A8F2E3B|nr:hypothetical protein [Muricauda sp. CAU 1633]MBO0321830.1 hypothetical protein [Muricauda sp. CAU 1633]
MTGSVALDVVIGLIFIYLLYSLFATVIMEIINSFLGLRARNLRYALRRMLMDEKEDQWVSNKNKYPRIVRWLIRSINLIPRTIVKLVNTALKTIGPAFRMADPGLFHTFYEQPSIKYLSTGGFSNKPSYIAPHNFSKTLVNSILANYSSKGIINRLHSESDVLASTMKQLGKNRIAKKEFDARKNKKQKFKTWFNKLDDSKKIKFGESLLPQGHVFKTQLKKMLESFDSNLEVMDKNLNAALEDVSLLERIQAGIAMLPEESDTKRHLKSLLVDAQDDLQKFQYYLEQWFDDAMERAIGWFKRRVQYFLFFIGVFLAVNFNADTFQIVKKLSSDPKAREHLVDMAIAYADDLNEQQNNVENNDVQQNLDADENKDTDENGDTNENEKFQNVQDSLKQVAGKLQNDIYKAQNIIVTNWRIPKNIEFYMDKEWVAHDIQRMKKNKVDSVVVSKDLKSRFILEEGETTLLWRTGADSLKITLSKCDENGYLFVTDNLKKKPVQFSPGDSLSVTPEMKIPIDGKKIYCHKNTVVFERTTPVFFKVHTSVDTLLLKSSIGTTNFSEFNRRIAPVRTLSYKMSYVFKKEKGFLNYGNLWGYILTALAISMGSPFWFDLLNRLIQLRNSIRPSKDEPSKNPATTEVPLPKRVG